MRTRLYAGTRAELAEHATPPLPVRSGELFGINTKFIGATARLFAITESGKGIVRHAGLRFEITQGIGTYVTQEEHVTGDLVGAKRFCFGLSDVKKLTMPIIDTEGRRSTAEMILRVFDNAMGRESKPRPYPVREIDVLTAQICTPSIGAMSSY